MLKIRTTLDNEILARKNMVELFCVQQAYNLKKEKEEGIGKAGLGLTS